MTDASKSYLGLVKGLSEVEMRALREIVRAELLSALYSRQEKEDPSPRLFRGIIRGEPRTGTYTDPGQVPLNGTFIADDDLFMEPGTYRFEDGKILERID